VRLGLAPLDERPVNTRYPAMLAAIAGVELLLPPADALPRRRRPADPDRLAAWLRQTAPALDRLIVSCELLGYGGLVASRTSDDPPAAVLARLDRLRQIARLPNHPPIDAFGLVARISDADDATEEPPYWRHHGRRLFRLSQALDRAARGDAAAAAEAARLRADAGAGVVADWLRRRVRNYAVNLGVLHLLAEGVVRTLILSSDDTSPDGLPSREKAWLETWADWLDAGDRLLMYPGADEVGCALLARAVAEATGRRPRIAPHYAVPGGEAEIAAFEDVPIATTVARQVAAAGADLADGDDPAAIWLAVSPPLPGRAEYDDARAAAALPDRLPHLHALVDEIGRRLSRGQAVAVADVAYPNGADPALTELLIERVDLAALAAYGAWNTAGNTLGTVVAQASLAHPTDAPARQTAQARFLLHRLLEDWGYQRLVRAELRQRFAGDPGGEELAAAATWTESRLGELLGRLPAFAGRWRIAPGSVRFPWHRFFEVDFDLEPRRT